ncbi:MAG: tRNA1(Val) (adenine(37)-N6)-methyltransferase [Syntrophomonadaceae bacterium]
MQSRSGYRFSIDAVLLAHFPELFSDMQIFDLGTGSGVIALLLAYRHSGVRITGVELQEQMVDRARRSVHYNHLEQQITIEQADIKEIPSLWAPAQADLVVCNPPFWKSGQGKLSRNPEQAIARHEIKIDLQAILEAGFHLLKPGGKIAMILPARRLPELFQELSQAKLSPTCLRMIHPAPHREAGHFLIEAAKATRKEITIMPPLIIYTAAGEYSWEIKNIYHQPAGEDVSEND